jgi:23S rRNA (cytidine1920-2'-O)/16S rRNA (cytidine1409-2'-O)-methyltransferase
MSTAPKSPKLRLDQILVERDLAPSRERAKALIMAGLVVVGEHTQTKAGEKVPADIPIRLKGDACPYVSRGGLKLAGALDHFGINPADYTCLDIGASTGGFTDCLLQRGAGKVFTIDVGSNQLAWALRSDPRVVWRENQNVRDLTREMIKADKIDLIVMDVSFISLRLTIPPLLPFFAEGARLLTLIKPQFEVGRDKVGKGGVVRDEAQRLKVVDEIRAFCWKLGLQTSDAVAADIKGPKGNQEYLILVELSR